MSAEHIFTAELWIWEARRSDMWTFVTVPPEVTTAIEDAADARAQASRDAGSRSGRVSARTSTASCSA